MSNLIDKKVEAARRASILDLQKFVMTQEQYEPEMKHYFSKNVYGREMSMKKGSLVIGKIHKFENLNIISKGKALVVSSDGAKVVEAPCTFVAQPGAKRVIVALEDLVWTNVHGTPETDVAKIEEEFIAKDFSEVLTQDEFELLGEALYELDDNRNGRSWISDKLHEPESASGK